MAKKETAEQATDERTAEQLEIDRICEEVRRLSQDTLQASYSRENWHNIMNDRNLAINDLINFMNKIL